MPVSLTSYVASLMKVILCSSFVRSRWPMQRFPSCILGSKCCALQSELRCSRHQASQLTPLSPLQPCSSAFLKIYLFNWRTITSQHCGGPCHTSTQISHVYMCVQPLEPPSHLPLHPIPLGYPRAPTLSAPLHASNLHWSSIVHMEIYMFQCKNLQAFENQISHNSKTSVDTYQ